MTESLLAEEETTTIDPNKNYLEELVGEGKKFKTAEDLARGKYEADTYIEIMKKRQDELRADYLKMRDEAMAKAKLEELISKLDNKQSHVDEPKNEERVKPLDLNEIDTLFSNKLREHEVARKQQENLKLVKDKLIERFGNNYQSTVKQQIESLGITEEVFTQMAQNYPQMVFKTLDIDKPRATEQFPAPPRNSVQGLPQSGKKDRTWTYYQELKKTNPRLYYDPKIAKQMHDDYQRLGEAFEDGDFKAYG